MLAGPRPKRLRLRVVGKAIEQTTWNAKGVAKTTKKAFASAQAAAEAFRKFVRAKMRADYVHLATAKAPGDLLLEAFAPGGGGGRVLDISPDGTQIVTASITSGQSFGAKLEVIEVATGARRVVVDEPAGGRQAFLHAALFDRPGTGIYFLLRDDTEHVDLASGIRRVVARGEGFNPHVVRPSFDAARRRLVVFGDNETVRVLDERDKPILEVPTAAKTTECRGAALSPSGSLLAVYIVSRGIIYGHDDAKHDTTNEVRIWDLESGKLWETVEMTSKVGDVGITPSDDQLVITRDYASGPVWLAIPAGTERARITDGSELARTRAWAYAPDGKRLALAGNQLRVIDVATGKDVALDAPFEYGGAECVAWSADGKRLASVVGGTAYVHAL